MYLIKYIFLSLWITNTSVHLSAQSEKLFFSSFDETSIAYQDLGKGSPVLLIHGFLSHGNSWNDTALTDSLLRKGYRVIIPDLRGNGASDRPNEENRYTDNAEIKDLVKLMDHLASSKFTAIGYGRGSILLAKLLTKDKRITKAILGGIGVDFTDRGWKKRKYLIEAFYEDGPLNLFNRDKFNHAVSLKLNTKTLGFLQKHQPFTSKAVLNRLTIPVLVISGSEAKENGDPVSLASLFPNGDLIFIKGNQKTTFYSSSFAKAILNWLQKK